ncbi:MULTISPECIES: ribosomal protein S18-alanine N-acetyltransferase [unclassified Arthrobacter]|uniref:ribosomal protein S18-alanine N-acetyltransferase n=1 Tax=unclassified Arthrobacter TaxID=235627 RepID=UPI00159DF3EB|nr:MULTISPECIES: ribosomal protein S18-alanine N-acetyltransferase [unclassified Arthrobacter]MCQ9164643.1 ribosomal protein S18-alanine N-acetyltransferase [Arthrobacter sp. STN4]NVM97212.1 ribosomal protein S18-alanine N-acetyltransferase [Arthrobacter sp. SDTb3-6]
MAASDVGPITAMDALLFGVDCWPRQLFEDELAAPLTRRYIVAEVPGGDGRPQTVGYAGLMCVPPIGDIQTIGVLPEFEGRGIARAMLAELIGEARRRGARDVMLEVSATNPRAQELYRRFGFEHIHTRRRYYRDGSDGLVMRLSVAAWTGAAAADAAETTDTKDPS